MKNACIIFLSLVIIILTAFGFSGKSKAPCEVGGEYLRIHIRADSNDGEAQAVKYAVRDELVAYLTPVVADCHSKAEATAEIQKRLPVLAEVAGGVLKKKGFFYGVRAELCVESFPTRIYGEYLLPAGEYSALIVYLGRGEGDNWWCVVYPPLCFTGGENILYKSKLQEIINRFYK